MGGLDIHFLDWEQADLDEMAQVACKSRQASPLWVESQTVEDFKNYLVGGKGRWPETTLISARRNQKLVGWLGVITEDPLIYELWRWHPFLSPDGDRTSVAQELLLASKKLAQDHDAQSLEVCCHFQKDQLSPEIERYYQIQQAMYERAGLQLSDEAVYLTSPVGKIKIIPQGLIPLPITMINHHPRFISKMYECYLSAFSAGQDRSFLNKTTLQQKAWFYDYLETDLNPEASKVLLEGERVIGFTLVQTRQRVGDEHLALIAVAPEYQEQGWGRKLISASIQTANLGGNDIFSIGVDLSNHIAYHLYLDLGFEIQTKLITHIWKNTS